MFIRFKATTVLPFIIFFLLTGCVSNPSKTDSEVNLRELGIGMASIERSKELCNFTQEDLQAINVTERSETLFYNIRGYTNSNEYAAGRDVILDASAEDFRNMISISKGYNSFDDFCSSIVHMAKLEAVDRRANMNQSIKEIYKKSAGIKLDEGQLGEIVNTIDASIGKVDQAGKTPYQIIMHASVMAMNNAPEQFSTELLTHIHAEYIEKTNLLYVEQEINLSVVLELLKSQKVVSSWISKSELVRLIEKKGRLENTMREELTTSICRGKGANEQMKQVTIIGQLSYKDKVLFTLIASKEQCEKLMEKYKHHL